MPTRYFLNSLRDREGTLPPPGVGAWQTDPDFLVHYAQSVHLDAQMDASSSGDRVPSVFQRPIRFYAALANTNDPSHTARRNEWRGLMAVLALSHWLAVQFKATPFSVPAVDPKAASHVGNAAAGDLHFRAALRNQLPHRSADGEDGGPKTRTSDWEKWWMLRCDDQLLGATSPWTLVYTAANYRTPESIPWQRNGLLTDPIHYYDPKGSRQNKPPELAILYNWVREMLDREATKPRREVWGYEPELEAYSNLLSTLLTSWARDLAPYRIDDRNDLKVSETRPLFNERPYSELLRVPVLTGDESDIYIQTKQGKVLLFHEHIDPNTRVFGSTFAFQVDVKALKAQGSEFHTRQGKLIQQPYISAEKFFFPLQLVQLKLAPDAFRPGDCTIPLPPEFFHFFEHRDTQWLSVTHIHDEWTAALNIPLANGTRVHFGKVYRADDVVKLSMDTPALALWPEYFDERWKGNFAAYAAPHSDDLLVQPLFPDGTVSRDRAEIASNRHEHSHQKEVRIWHTERPAIGFALTLRLDDDRERPVGLVLRRELSVAKALVKGESWRIGVDFGTSSTTVMMDVHNEIREMPFGPHLLALTLAPERQVEITRNLYPTESVTPPFGTLLYHNAATQFGAQRNPYTLRFSANPVDDILNKPVKDLKWGVQASSGGANPLITYLDALVRYIVWEARIQGVQKLHLYWSYPTSLPSGALGIMENFWNGVPYPENKPHRDMDVEVHAPLSESEAACRALIEKADAKVLAGVLTVGVDVGGGSSDIAYWSKQQMLDQVSFKIAGNDMLDPNLLDDDTLLEIFEICTNQRLDRSKSSSVLRTILERPEIYVSGALAAAQKEADPRYHPLRTHILKGGRENVTPWIELRSLIYLFFTGLCYYIGSQARLFGVASPEIDVYFGGRGSTLLTWLSSSSETVQSVLERALRIGLERPVDDGVPIAFPAGSVRVRFGGLPIAYSDQLPKLKSEVARGLLTSPALKLGQREPQKGVVIGEKGWKDKEGRDLAWNMRLTAEQLASLSAPDTASFDSTMIGHFRSEMLGKDAEAILEKLNLDALLLGSLELHGSEITNMIGRSTVTENAAQPLFAYELRALMTQYVLSAKTRLSVKAEGVA